MNKASGGDGIPAELFQILKDDAVKMLHSTCQQISKTQQWSQDWKRVVFIPIPKKGNAKECSSYCTIALISHASKVMLKILKSRLQQHVNCELPDVQDGFRKSRATRDQIANICWIIKKASSVQLSCSVVSDYLWPHEWQHTRPPCPSSTPRVYSNPYPLSQWCHPTISSSVVPFSSFPQSLPASGSFPMSQLFAWGSQSIGVSASTSVLPMNKQDWSPLGWTGWISLKSKGLSRVFSNTTVQKHQFFNTQLFFIVQLSHPYTTTGKTIALTRWTFVDKVMSLLSNMLSRLVIIFLLRSKCLLISWLQSPSAVILEPRKIKSATLSPSICHEVMGPDVMILVFWMLSFKQTFSLSSFIFIKKLFSSSSFSAKEWCHLSSSTGSSKKQESSRKISISALPTMPKPLTMWITINCGTFWKRWEYQTTWPAYWETCI